MWVVCVIFWHLLDVSRGLQRTGFCNIHTKLFIAAAPRRRLLQYRRVLLAGGVVAGGVRRTGTTDETRRLSIPLPHTMRYNRAASA